MITVVLDLPPKQLSPNAAGASRWKSSYVTKYRDHAREETMVAIAQLRYDQRLDLPFDAAMCRLAFYWQDMRKRDEANSIAWMKAGIDGIVRGGLLVDDDWTRLKYDETFFYVDKEKPRVELRFIPIARRTMLRVTR